MYHAICRSICRSTKLVTHLSIFTLLRSQRSQASRLAGLALLGATLLSACQMTPVETVTPVESKEVAPPPPAPDAAPTVTPASPPPTPSKPAANKPGSMAAPVNKRNGDSELKQGLADYGNGAYTAASQHLQNALSFGLARTADRIAANKYLAFIACASGEAAPCRYHFRKVLLINPRFELSKNEAGHPLWGPVFKEVKAEISASSKVKK